MSKSIEYLDAFSENNKYEIPIPNKKTNKLNKINGQLMHKDRIVANIVNDELQVINFQFLPSYFKLKGDLKTWLENRCIDMHRRNSRLLRRVLSIRTTNEIEVVLSVHAHTLTDNYWIRLNNEENLKYEDIRYSKDLLFDTALKGSVPSFEDFLNKQIKENSYKGKAKFYKFHNLGSEDKTDLMKTYSKEFSELVLRTPELTLGGSFEKGWKLIGGNWYLVKAGNNLNNSAELIASYLGELFKFNIVKYEKYNDYCVCCENFTDNLKYDFEPMFDFLNETDDIEESLEYIERINKDFVQDFMDMVFLDALMLNPDRHTNNYGFLRDSETGEFVGLAPNFDNNLALFSTREYVNNIDIGNEGQIKNFYLPVLKEYGYKIPDLSYENLYKIVEKAYTYFKPRNFDVEFTTKFIWSKYNYIKQNI